MVNHWPGISKNVPAKKTKEFYPSQDTYFPPIEVYVLLFTFLFFPFLGNSYVKQLLFSNTGQKP